MPTTPVLGIPYLSSGLPSRTRQLDQALLDRVNAAYDVIDAATVSGAALGAAPFILSAPSGTLPGADVIGSTFFVDESMVDNTVEVTASKGAALGYASLDAGAKVPAGQITGVLSSSGLTNDAALEKVANKAAASGYASLDGSTLVPVAQLGTGSPTAHSRLRGDRTWKTPSNAVDVADVAAIGQADDTATVHAARDLAGAGGTVYFSAGTYNVTGLTANKAGQQWLLHPNATIRLNNAANTHVILVTAADVRVEGRGTLDCNGSNQSVGPCHGVKATGARPYLSGFAVQNVRDGATGRSFGISLEGVSGGVVENCRVSAGGVRDDRGSGIQVYDACTDCTVRGCTVTLCANAILSDGRYGATSTKDAASVHSNYRIQFVNNYASSWYGVQFNNTHDSLMVGNTSRDAWDICIDLEYCNRCTVTGNTAIGAAAVASAAGPTQRTAYGLCLFQGDQWCVLNGNTAKGCQQGIGVGGVGTTNDTSECSLTGNSAIGNTSDGIHLYQTAKIVLTGNVCQGNAGFGIFVSRSPNATTGCQIVGNYVSGNTGYGIDALSTGNYIVGNYVSGNTGGDINAGSSSSDGNHRLLNQGDSAAVGNSNLGPFTVHGSVTMDGTNNQFLAVGSNDASHPAYSFAGATNNGMRYDATNYPGGVVWTASGTDRWAVHSAGALLSVGDNVNDFGASGSGRAKVVFAGTAFRGPAGSASAPTFSFDGATNNGTYYDGFGGIAWATSGTAAWGIDSSQRLYPFTATDLGKSGNRVGKGWFTTLDVSGAATVGGQLNVTGGSRVRPTDGTTAVSMFAAAALGFVGTQTNHPLVLTVFDVEAARFDTSRRFGVGGSPTRRLTVSDTTNVYLSFNDGATEKWAFGSESGTFILYDTTAGAYRMKVDGSGHWLPGTDNAQDAGSPSKRLKNVYAGTQFLGVAGSATAPSFSFDGATNNGMYYDGSGGIAFATGGTNRGGPDSSGVWTIPTGGTALKLTGSGGRMTASDGTATAPSYAFAGATDSGVYRPAAGGVGFTTGSTHRMRVAPSGDILLGAESALATNATSGFPFIPYCSGTPTGSFTSVTGMVPMVWDETNSRLYVRSNGGTWKSAAFT